LKEKAKLIHNIADCLIHYNRWVAVNQPLQAVGYEPETLNRAAELEYQKWKSPNAGSRLTYTDVPREKLAWSDLKFN
jgi:hypothetical protein